MARKVKYYSAKRRAVMAAGEIIDHLTVFERDNWICGICKGPVNKYLRKPNPFCATIDHIIPICIALAVMPIDEIHTYANTQLAHYKCNIAKAQSIDTDVTNVVD